jgi:DNA-binding MarR family transcriptional regulator
MDQSDFLDLDCLAYATRRAGRAVTNYFNAQLAGLDLNVSQFGLLAAVAKMPGATLAGIGEAMLIDGSTLARNFAVMERRGLISVEGGRGRGGKHLTLTRAGAKLHAEAGSIWRATNRKLAGELSAEKAAAGRAFLRTLGMAAERLKQRPEREVAADKPARRRVRARA